MAELLDPFGNQLPTVSAAVPITVASLPPVAGSSDITLPPSAPSEYLRQMAGITLAREGFEGAEAGALSEVERLLENHILDLFRSASEYAELANRLTPNAADLLSAQEEVGGERDITSLQRESRESKRRRIALELPVIPAPPAPAPLRTLDLLVDFAQNPKSNLNTDVESNSTLPESGMMEDIKPSLSEMERSTRVGGASASMAGAGGENEDKKERTGSLPPYAHAGAPGLPGAWTRPRWDRVPKQDDTPPPESLLVTASSLEFVRKSASSGDIPPELGIVNYRLVKGKDRKRGAASEGYGGGVDRSAAW